MAISYVRAATGVGSVATLDLTNFVVDGSDRFTAVAIGQLVGTFPTISSVVWDPTGVNEALQSIGATSTTDAKMSLYGRAGLTAKTATLRITLASSDILRVGATHYTGVHQTTPTGTVATAAGTGGTPSVTVSSVNSTDLVIDGVVHEDANVGAAGADQTERWNAVSTPTIHGAKGSTQAGSAGGVMSWASTGEKWALVAVALKVSAGAGSRPFRRGVSRFFPQRRR
jgi:hypothetical protein